MDKPAVNELLDEPMPGSYAKTDAMQMVLHTMWEDAGRLGTTNKSRRPRAPVKLLRPGHRFLSRPRKNLSNVKSKGFKQ